MVLYGSKYIIYVGTPGTPRELRGAEGAVFGTRSMDALQISSIGGRLAFVVYNGITLPMFIQTQKTRHGNPGLQWLTRRAPYCDTQSNNGIPGVMLLPCACDLRWRCRACYAVG